MSRKSLAYFIFVLILAGGTIFSIFKFTDRNKVSNGIIEANHQHTFKSTPDISAILYGKPSCPYCKLAVKELDRQGIKYIYRNIKDSREALNEFAALNGNAIPLLITRNLRITGYQPQWYSKAILVDSDLSFYTQVGNTNL